MINLFNDYSIFDQVLNTNTKTKITKNENDYNLFITVPGLSKEDIKISVKDNTLSISYESNEKNYFTESFVKRYQLPNHTDIENINAKIENGILEIIIPSLKKTPTEKIISIK